MTIITMLQAQIVALQNAAPAAAAAPPAGAATVVFADMPQMLGANDLIDYSTKRGPTIFEQGCKPVNDKTLTDGFAMTPDQTVIFTEAFHCRATTMGWNQGARQITLFANSAGRQINIIKSYGQIHEATLKFDSERFCKPGGVDSQTHAKQNNTMMSICLAKLLTADAQARLLTYQNKYTFDGVKYAPLMYKIIMRLATINSVATTQTLHDNLQLLGTYAAMVSGNINKVHSEFDKNYSQLIARGAIVDDPIGILFEVYLVVPCHHFKSYIRQQHKDYLNGKLTTITYEALMSLAKCKFDWLKTKGLWGAKSPDDEKIVAMTAALNKRSKANSTWTLNSTLLQMKERKRATRGTRRRTRRILTINGNRRRMKPGRKSHQRKVKSPRKKWASTLTTGVNITWRGPCTSPPTASRVSSTRKIRRRSRTRPTPVPLLLPLQPQ
jgi:hypothetical protein